MCEAERDLADYRARYDSLLTSYNYLEIDRNRLRDALAASCEENRSVALAEPGRTATCPLERELRREVAACRRLLRSLAAKAVRHKFNANWLEVTVTQDELDAVIDAATERAATAGEGE